MGRGGRWRLPIGSPGRRLDILHGRNGGGAAPVIIFVAVGDSAVIRRSVDGGVTWTAPTSATAQAQQGVTWSVSDELFISVGGSLTKQTSPDGITWTLRGGTGTGTYTGVACGTNRCVALGSTASTLLGEFSDDGISWTGVTGAGASAAPSCIASAGAGFAAGCTGGALRHAHSADGQSWTAVAGGNLITGVAFGGGRYAYASNVGNWWFSTNGGVTLTAAAAPPTGAFFSITYGGGQFVAVGTDVAATSPDGSNWTQRTMASGDYRGVTYSASLGRYVAVANVDRRATSPDGIIWTGSGPGGGSILRSVTVNM